MQINFLSGGHKESAPPSDIIADVEAWYDRSLRLWTCIWVDAEGNQLGPAQYEPRKADKDRTVSWMKTSIGEVQSVSY